MAAPRLHRSHWQRTSRPRVWTKFMLSRAPVASRRAGKTGGQETIRSYLSELRADEAFQDSPLTVNVKR